MGVPWEKKKVTLLMTTTGGLCFTKKELDVIVLQIVSLVHDNRRGNNDEGE